MRVVLVERRRTRTQAEEALKRSLGVAAIKGTLRQAFGESLGRGLRDVDAKSNRGTRRYCGLRTLLGCVVRVWRNARGLLSADEVCKRTGRLRGTTCVDLESRGVHHSGALLGGLRRSSCART